MKKVVKSEEYRITGKILDFQNRGLSNLMVIFYDVDKHINLEKSLDPLKELENNGSERLGSTYTDTIGKFSFNYSYQDFAPDNEEKRPDLVVLVTDAEQIKYSEFKDRLLHISNLSIKNASRNESIIIRLSKNDIEQKLVSEIALDRHIAEVENTQQEAINGVSNRVKRALARKSAGQVDNNEKTIQLSKLSKSTRSNKKFISKPSELSQAQEQVLEEATVRFSAMEKGSNSAVINLSVEDAKLLDIELDDLDSGQVVKIPYGKYCSLINRKNAGKTLVRTIKLSDLIELQEENSTDEQSNNDEVEVYNSNHDNSDIEESRESVKKHISDQLSRIYKEKRNVSSSSENTHTNENNISVRIIDRNSQSAADQTAYHDFDHLQIAFDSVWSEAFDSKLNNLFADFYNEVINEMDSHGENLKEERNRIIAKLEQILEGEQLNFKLIISELSDVANVIGDGIPVPDRLLDIGILKSNDKNEIYSSKEINTGWSKLSIGQQNRIVKLLDNIKKDEVNLDAYFSLDENARRLKILSILNPEGTSGFKYIDQIAKSLINNTWDDGQSGKNLYQIWQHYSNQGNYKSEMLEWRKDFFNQIRNNRDRFDLDNLSFFSPKDKIDLRRGLRSNGEEFFFSFEPFIKEIYGVSTTKSNNSLIASIFNNPQGIISRTEEFIRQINERLLEPYSFQIFAPNSVNYGIITTYRQEWKPENWQVGDLVSTIPLTPGEKRKYSKKLKVKKTRAEKEIDKSIYNRSDESSYISKAHSEIIGKARSATNFSTSVKGNIQYSAAGVIQGGISNSTSFKEDQATESARTKKSIRESTQKAKNEYKNERSLEISTTDVYDYEDSSSGEISNPNNEITVTYLFYELERQYRISERLHKLTPVILVAFDVPEPHEVDEDWLLTHEWILRRILLDDSFNEALDYLREGIIGDQINFEAAKGHYSDQKKIVQEVSGNVESLSLLKATLQEELNRSTDSQNLVEFNNRRRSSMMNIGVIGAIFNPAAWPVVAGAKVISDAEGTGDPYDAEYYEAERKAYESRLNLTNEELRNSLAELAREENALEKAKNQMMVLTNRVFTKRNLINQLRIHVKQNILYYMQGIWAHEPPDQRYFRLYDKPAPMLEPTDPVELKKKTIEVLSEIYNAQKLGGYNPYMLPIEAYLPKPYSVNSDRNLHDVADLDNLLGFKGNYAIFPLRECTYLTDFMMKDYIDEVLGLGDPDTLNKFSLVELEEMYHKLENNTEKQELRDAIAELITTKLTQPVKDNELVVVPTGQLYIEALTGKHALLEEFKLKHRAIDVEKAREEVREIQIDNLRRSARILEGNYEDGNIDKNIIISGQPDININE